MRGLAVAIGEAASARREPESDPGLRTNPTPEHHALNGWNLEETAPRTGGDSGKQGLPLSSKRRAARLQRGETTRSWAHDQTYTLNIPESEQLARTARCRRRKRTGMTTSTCTLAPILPNQFHVHDPTFHAVTNNPDQTLSVSPRPSSCSDPLPKLCDGWFVKANFRHILHLIGCCGSRWRRSASVSLQLGYPLRYCKRDLPDIAFLADDGDNSQYRIWPVSGGRLWYEPFPPRRPARLPGFSVGQP